MIPSSGRPLDYSADVRRENRELHRLRDENEQLRRDLQFALAANEKLRTRADEACEASKAQAYEIRQLTRAFERTRPLRDLESAVKFYLDNDHDEYERITRLHEAVRKLPPALGEAQR